MNATPHRRTFAPLVAGFLLGLGLLALPAGAAPRDGFFLPFPWSLLSSLWENIGLIADPDGRPSDIGLEMDPGGRTAPGMLSGNIGLIADPNGQPAVNPGTQNIGLEADPGGQPSH